MAFSRGGTHPKCYVLAGRVAGEVALMPASTQEVQERRAALGPWFYEFDLGVHGRTMSSLPPEVLPIHQTRLQMVDQVVDGYFGSRLQEIRCLDVGCHEGYYSVAMARKGMREVRGVDVRESSLAKATFVRDALGLGNLAFERQNCEDLRLEESDPFELTLFLGILYHLENPMLCL